MTRKGVFGGGGMLTKYKNCQRKLVLQGKNSSKDENVTGEGSSDVGRGRKRNKG